MDKTILIAEPEEELAEELGPFLLRELFLTIRTSNLKETLLAIQNERVDALVLDSDLLIEDCDFVSVIKGMGKNLPIIICAENNTPEFESRIRHQGIFFYHIKSFGVQDLEMAVVNAVNKSLK
ncbi:MAG: hypothetical protein KKC20_02355 [Proteobacteria bacterium]|nr:hypothetical protein [Pseudomonadota bacterium]